MKLITKTAFILMLSAGQALALSCLAPDPARDFQRIAASETTYVVVKGVFEFAARPERPTEQNPQTQSFAAKFSGRLLTGAGFTDDIADVLVTINSNCAGQWCGSVDPGVPYLAFIEQDGRNLTLQAKACPFNHFRDPGEATIKVIEYCAAGKTCEPSE